MIGQPFARKTVGVTPADERRLRIAQKRMTFVGIYDHQERSTGLTIPGENIGIVAFDASAGAKFKAMLSQCQISKTRL
jgi:hypothetical protein